VSGAETLLRVLRAMGGERIFASPGSDWAPLWEALAKLHWPDVPEYLSSRHEETAVGMATGYAKATGKLPAVVLHTTVGALHATMGVRKSTRLNSSHVAISYAVFCLKKKKNKALNNYPSNEITIK